MQKREILFLCLGFILLLFTVACSQSNSNGETEDGKITLDLWYWNRSIDDELIEKVNEEFPDITVNPQKIDGENYKTKLQATLSAGSGGPDIVALNDWVNEFLPHSEHFINLYDYGADEIEDLYLDWKWNYALTADQETIIALPMDTGPTALFYRVDIFEEAGLPTEPEEVAEQLATWDDYIAAAETLEANTDAKMFDSINRVFTQILAQSEENYFDRDDNFIGDQGAIKHAWDVAVTIHEKGLSADVGVDGTDWNASMNNGKVASFIGAVWTKKILKDAAPDTEGKWRVARAPGGDGNNGGSFIGILKSTEYPDEAYQVIEWMMNEENQLQSYLTMDLYPSTPSVFEDPEMGRAEEFFGGQDTTEIFSESAKNVNPIYFGPNRTTVNGFFGDALEDIEKLDEDPDESWDEVLEQVDKELSR